jgi:hypothetical protein
VHCHSRRAGLEPEGIPQEGIESFASKPFLNRREISVKKWVPNMETINAMACDRELAKEEKSE